MGADIVVNGESWVVLTAKCVVVPDVPSDSFNGVLELGDEDGFLHSHAFQLLVISAVIEDKVQTRRALAPCDPGIDLIRGSCG